MAKINILKAFRLNHHNAIRDFKPGIVEVDQEVAEHWYVKAHSEPIAAEAEKAAPDPGIVADAGEPAPEGQQAGEGSGAPPAPSGEQQGGDTPQPPAPSNDGDHAAEAEKVALKAEAEALGIDVDGRWGIPKLKAAIAEKKSAA